MSLEKKLKALMDQHDDSADDVADKTGLGRATVYAILSGKRGKRSSFEVVEKIAKAYGLPLEFFSSKSQHMQTTPRGNR